MTYEAAPWAELASRWRWLEELGYDSLWAGDHVWSSLNDGQVSRPRFDAWLLAGGIAAATTRVAVGTLVSSIAHRNPAIVAKQAVTVDHISGGRLVVGLGAGGNPADHAVTGVPLWSSRERAARLGESAAIVAGLLGSDSFDYNGEYYTVSGAVRAPAPVQAPRPPLLVAAHVPDTLAVAARYADIWSSYGSLFSQLRRGQRLSEAEAVDVTRQRAQRLDELAAAAGRRPGSIRKSFMAGFTDDQPWESVERFRDFIGRYTAIGITEFMFPYPLQGKAGEGVFEAVSLEVLPALRRLCDAATRHDPAATRMIQR
jgi:alkanesulfonate monooxygenase SsuD/methylene tetrahydromethanopterin reductase-like flavin-dependent oxidoreductase (luciferase family)